MPREIQTYDRGWLKHKLRYYWPMRNESKFARSCCRSFLYELRRMDRA